MADEHDPVVTIRDYTRRGAYADAVRYAESLPEETRRRPGVALQLARAWLRQGHPLRGEAALAATDLAGATTGERLIHALETEALHIFRHGVQAGVTSTAEAIFAAIDPFQIDPVDLAEIKRIRIRILLFAVTYWEVSRATATAALEELPDIATRLEAAGRIDEAVAARFTHADRLAMGQARLDALTRFAADALRVDRAESAAEAYVARAEQMLGEGAPSEDVTQSLEVARDLYARIGHQHGRIDVERLRTMLAIDRSLVGLDGLDACLAAYRDIDFFRGALSTLLDLSQLSHVRGDTGAAARYRREALTLSQHAGMALSIDADRMGQIDLLIRAQRLGEAKELCEAALAENLPAWMHASYEQLLGTVYSFLDDPLAASAHARKSIDLYTSVGDVASASNTVLKLANDLSSMRRDDAFDEALTLLRDWLREDDVQQRTSDAIAKRGMLAQIHVLQFLYSPARRGDPALFDDAEAMLIAAERATDRLSPREAARQRGSIEQQRAQVLQARGDEEGVFAAWRRAAAHYEPAGLGMEAANCQYILGVGYLNRANVELLPNFESAEAHLRAALGYYDSAGMRRQAADTHEMFARLYTNAAVRTPIEVSAKLLDAALDHLSAAEQDADAIRREFDAGASATEVQQAKGALVAKTRRNAELAVEILCRLRPDPAEAWRRVQRAKARALVDILGMSSAPPARVLSTLTQHPDVLRLIAQEREISARLRRASADQRRGLRTELDLLRAQMANDSRLRHYLELRTGAALDEDDLSSMLFGTPCVCVDWTTDGERLFLLSVRPGDQPQLTPLSLRVREVQTFVQTHLAPDTFRITLRDTPELLDELTPLIDPLSTLTQPEELLILSPTGPLHALPLHALAVDGDPLIARNPVVYTSSLTVLRHCLGRAVTRLPARSAALFGDPTGDRDEAAALVAHLEQQFETPALLRGDVTLAAFRTGVAGRDLVHFHGHAKHVPQEPLDSWLAFADGKLTARDVFELADLRADLVTLAACESASSAIAPGDEPLGLIPAFLYAGAMSVLATLWKVQQGSAARTMRHFYDTWTAQADLDKARVLRAAVLATRATAGFESPYHWAAFVLHGSWH
ncbi:MAG TPA: CHAT domain-containing protein [Thermoanaerobaculia bacterium]|nr:CHAT domain-containing protein [Thermoanaerobaculia bacterium]